MNLSRSPSTQMTPATINIITAEKIGDFHIRLKFDDGTEQTLNQRSPTPLIIERQGRVPAPNSPQAKKPVV